MLESEIQSNSIVCSRQSKIIASSNYKLHGNKPFEICVLHGGPGAIGELEPIARYASNFLPTIEYLQQNTTINEEIYDLNKLLLNKASNNVTLIGHSFGAMLAILAASKNPSIFKKLILICCPPLDQKKSSKTLETRFERLNQDEQNALKICFDSIPKCSDTEKLSVFKKIKALFDKTDNFNPDFNLQSKTINFSINIFESIWNEAVSLRNKGNFLNAIHKIKCPITFIHGEYDPHPFDAISEIANSLENANLILLKKCGHTPWIEKDAKDKFYKILNKEIIQQKPILCFLK